MEFPRRAVNVERVLAVLALAAALAVAWSERGSTVATAVREQRPWLAWIAAYDGDAAPALQLAMYQPARRRLTLVHVPGELKLGRRKTLDGVYVESLKASGAPREAARAAEDAAQARLQELAPDLPPASARLTLAMPAPEPGDEPSVNAAGALKADGRRPRAWLSRVRAAVRGLIHRDRTALDPLLFAVELRRLHQGDLRPARLPDDAQAPAFLTQALSAEEPAPEARAATLEVLNGTTEPRLALRAVKMLRLRGIDVLTTGGARPRARTLVFDRTGDFRRADRLRAALGCPAARAVTRIDPLRGVDVSVELGADCAGAFGTENREP